MLELEDKSKTMLCVIKFINMLMCVLFVKLFSVVVCSDVYLKIGVGLFLLFCVCSSTTNPHTNAHKYQKLIPSPRAQNNVFHRLRNIITL